MMGISLRFNFKKSTSKEEEEDKKKKRRRRASMPMELGPNPKLSSFYAAKANAMRALLFAREDRHVQMRFQKVLDERKQVRYVKQDDSHPLYEQHTKVLEALKADHHRQGVRQALLQSFDIVSGWG
ncbi:unnamed protein product [Calicophoron daubneyi]|uniref:Uncharacterized protein n=1 Tax=Calicophoron daubneyi TaxID=300641 RepID=A0AAV2TGT3_CALDB